MEQLVHFLQESVKIPYEMPSPFFVLDENAFRKFSNAVQDFYKTNPTVTYMVRDSHGRTEITSDFPPTTQLSINEIKDTCSHYVDVEIDFLFSDNDSIFVLTVRYSEVFFVSIRYVDRNDKKSNANQQLQKILVDIFNVD